MLSEIVAAAIGYSENARSAAKNLSQKDRMHLSEKHIDKKTGLLKTVNVYGPDSHADAQLKIAHF